MPRSSRHKSSKHSSRDARDYSDSEKDLSLKEKEKKSKEESSGKFSKKPGSVEKRKLDSKDTSKELWISENGDYVEYSSSKRRKDKADDRVSDRWNGGEDDGKVEKKSRSSSESKSKRREDAEGDDTKRSKSEGKHRESSRKEEREREKKGKEGKSDRLIESEDHRPLRQSAERTELHVPDRLQSPESDSLHERQIRKKRDASDDGDKHLEDNGGILDRQLSISSDTGKDARAKDESYKDKYREDMNCEDKCRDNKLRGDRSASDLANSKSSEKHLRDGKDNAKVKQKKSKVQDSDFERDHDHDRERDRDRDHEHDLERERYCDLDRDHYRDHDRNRDHDHDRDYDYKWDRERDRHCNDRDKDRDHDRDEHDERRSARYKDSKGRKRSPDDRDDGIGSNTKSRSTKLHYSVMNIKSSTSGRVEVDSDRGRSQSHPANFDASTGSSRRRASPSSISHGGTDEYRHLKQEDSNYRDQKTEQRSKAASSREVTSLTPERGTKYRTMEKSNRVDEGHFGELPIERSSSSKASPMSMKERSPSTSLERRYMSRSGVKWDLDIEETGWTNASSGGREEDNKLSRDIPPEKPLLDGSFQADSVFYNKAGQGNSSLISHPPGLRPGIGSPSFMGSIEEDNRFNNNGRYKRSGNLNVRRGHANGWRGAPNWPAPVPNGFIPFQPGPPHGGFQAMIPHFRSPSLFGVRPSMEINHSGIPYHIPDAESFSNHLRPMGWQNTMDGSGPAPFHCWDGHNVNFRDEGHMFGPPEWDQSRHTVNGRGWDTGSDVWKGQNGDSDLPATSQKEDHPLQVTLDDVYDGPESQYENGNNCVQVKGLEIRSDVLSPIDGSSRFSSEIPHKAPDSSKISCEDNDACCCQAYLCKLDISAELAGSELYDQCMSLMNMQRNKDLSKDVIMLVTLKNGGRPIQNTSIAVLSPSLIPPANASVFRRAMVLYKKHQLQVGAVPNVNGRTLAFTSATMKGKEQSSDHVVDLAEKSGPISDAEMVDSEMLDSDQRKGEAVRTATCHENMEQLASTQSRELLDHPDSLSPEKPELPNTDFGHMNVEVPKPVLNGNKTEESETDQMNSGDAAGDPLQSLDNAADAVHLAADEENSNNINKTEGNSSVNCVKGTHTSCDSISGSLNESPQVNESVISSLIHHSPESTH